MIVVITLALDSRNVCDVVSELISILKPLYTGMSASNFYAKHSLHPWMIRKFADKMEGVL